jgi:hypothetical protein
MSRERAQRVSHVSGAGIPGVPASERVGESEGRSSSGERDEVRALLRAHDAAMAQGHSQ